MTATFVEARAAWDARDAARMLPGDPAEVFVRTPDGRTLARGDVVRDLQRRMDMTVSIDAMTEEVERIELIGDRAVVYSRQRFSRVMALPEGVQRRRISTVLHKRQLHKIDRRWQIVGTVEELEPTARWAD